MEDQLHIDEDWKAQAEEEKQAMASMSEKEEPVWVDFNEVKGFLGHIQVALASIGTNITQTIDLIEQQIMNDKENGEQTNDED